MRTTVNERGVPSFRNLPPQTRAMESPQGNESSNSSTSTPGQEGTLLRVQQDFYERLERDNYNKTLFIEHLQQKIKLLQSGEGYYVLDVLKELRWLRCRLQDTRQTVHGQARKIREDTEDIKLLKQQLREKDPSEKKQLADKAENLSRQNKRLVDELAIEAQGLERDNHQQLEKQHDIQCDLEKTKREVNAHQLETRTLKRKVAEAEKELRRAERDIWVLSEHKVLYEEQQRDVKTLKASNHLLHDEVQERRRRCEKMAKTSKNMREEIDIYKEVIAERDVEIEKLALRLQGRSSNEALKKALMEQLEETKTMLAAVSERLETSPIGPEDRVPLGCNLKLSDSTRCRLKATHGKRLSLLSKKLEGLSQQVEL